MSLGVSNAPDCRSVRSPGFLGAAYLTPRIASVAVLSLPRRAWFRNRFLTWSGASLIRETMWNESSTRSAFGRRSFTLASIHLAPSPVTALMEARCSSVGCRKNRPSTSLPYPSCAQATRLRLWSTATVMYVCPLPAAGLVHAYRGGTVEHARHRGFQPGGDPARDMAGRPPRDAWESARGLLVGDRRRPRALHLETTGEPAVRLRPRHLGGHHAMLRARHARRQAHELDPIAAEVLVAPSPFAAPVVVLGALAPATRATQRALPAPHPDHRRGSGTQRRVVDGHVLDDHAFDVQQPFEYVLHKAFSVSGFPEQKTRYRKRPLTPWDSTAHRRATAHENNTRAEKSRGKRPRHLEAFLTENQLPYTVCCL